MQKKECVDKLNNDSRHTWTKAPYFLPNCLFCENYSQKFFTCLVCLRPAARAHMRAHDFNGSKDDVICCPCVQKYWDKMSFL